MAVRPNPKSHDPSALLAAFAERCAANGIAETPQRRSIYRVLAESLEHPTAEGVYLAIKSEIPGISLATVYRNLKLFADRGLIDEVATGASVARFDANQRPHHHLICDECGSVVDSYSKAFAGLGRPGAEIDGFVVRDAKVNVYGACPDCRTAAGHND